MARVVDSSFADLFVPKGGVFLTSDGLCGWTRDVDTEAIDVVRDREHCWQRVAPIAAAARDDGVVFDAIPNLIEHFADEDEYWARRAQLASRLDIGTGDPAG